MLINYLCCGVFKFNITVVFFFYYLSVGNIIIETCDYIFIVIGFSQNECNSLRELLQAKLAALEEQAYELAGHVFSLTSPDDISKVSDTNKFGLHVTINVGNK